jgi:hypothetical protein
MLLLLQERNSLMLLLLQERNSLMLLLQLSLLQ